MSPVRVSRFAYRFNRYTVSAHIRGARLFDQPNAAPIIAVLKTPHCFSYANLTGNIYCSLLSSVRHTVALFPQNFIKL